MMDLDRAMWWPSRLDRPVHHEPRHAAELPQVPETVS